MIDISRSFFNMIIELICFVRALSLSHETKQHTYRITSTDRGFLLLDRNLINGTRMRLSVYVEIKG